MNIGLIGSTRLTRQVFHFLAARGGIQFAVGLPDDRLSDKADGVPMDSLCAQHGTPLLKPRRLVEAVAEIRRFAPDLILEFGDSRIVPPELLSLPRLGVVGNHGAILPMVKGGASLPWGRMLASGTWGVSLFFLEPAIDSGGIVGTSRFSFPADCVMRRFVNLANEATLRLLEEVFPKLTRGMFAAQPNPPADIRVPPGTDACEVKRLFTDAHARGQRIYLPPRTPAEAVVNPRWPAEFVHAFKLANDAPYPRWQDASSRCHGQ